MNTKKNILIVSNNALSETHNNGKTLSSLVREYPLENLSQLYFSDETPSFNVCKRFFKISDIDILKRLNGRAIEKPSSLQANVVTQNKQFYSKIRNIQTARLLREVAWRYLSFNKAKLFKWLDQQQPDVIIFCAGDSLFAYDIVNTIANKYKCKLIVYITDDYILPRLNLSPCWWIRRNSIFDNMQYVINRCDLLLTVSNTMQAKYKEVFSKDSLVFFNRPESLKTHESFKKSEKIELIYAGGFHFKRWKVLNKIALAIQDYNKRHEKQAFLKIYSNSVPNKKILKKLNICHSSKFFGSLNSDQLKTELNRADILVHVEAFDFNSRMSTMLSLSTKIPEYLSINNTILAVGPEEVASIKHLEQYPQAFIVNKPRRISKDVQKILNIKSKDLSAYTGVNGALSNEEDFVTLDTILESISHF